MEYYENLEKEFDLNSGYKIEFRKNALFQEE